MDTLAEVVAALGGLGTVAPSTILTLFVIAIMSGKLVPIKTVTTLIADATYWRDLALKGQETNSKLAESVETLMETTRTMDHFIRSLPAAKPDASGEEGEK